MEVPLYTDEDHNHFVDLYFVLLYKFQRKTFLDEVIESSSVCGSIDYSISNQNT